MLHGASDGCARSHGSTPWLSIVRDRRPRPSCPGRPPPASRRLDKAARPTPERRRLVSPCVGRSSRLRPVASAPCSPDHGERPSPPREGKASPHAPGVVGRGFAAAVVAPARAGRSRRAALDCRRQRKKASPAGDGLGQRSGLQNRRHEIRAGVLLVVACHALKGSRVRRRWPSPETREPDAPAGLLEER